MTEVPLQCRCGKVRGRALEVSPKTVNRVVCYCRDCRALLRWLDRADLLDAAGGSDIVQLARARVRFEEGMGEVRCMRLSDKGLHRFYAGCCNTPVGNTVPRVPFLGVARALFATDDLDALAGRAVRVQVRSATAPLEGASDFAPRMWAHVSWLLLGWWVRGLGGEALIDPKTHASRTPVRVLTPDERARLADP